MANGAFGIEHPLVTVHDIAAVAARYEAIGFDPTPLGRHPWGTVNRLVMFPDNFIELIGVGDAAAIEADPVGGHKFGRRVRDSLALGEGISLMALHSKDAIADARTAVARGAESAGQVDFRRAVRLPDGTRDEAVVTLSILPDATHPGLSFFLCHQHKPHLVWNPDWLRHRNQADAITAVTYLAPEPDDVVDRFRTVWGADAVTVQPGGYRIATAGGLIHLLDHAAVAAKFPGMALPEGADRRAPCGVAISVHTPALAMAGPMALQAPGARALRGRVLVPAAYAGGVILEIHG
ncbi:VOC family protein [Limobrevibacterium gyesilva]|uniref:VOC family protein n=1 Tax=Limobrevibacterium gyesilva TaxID=2991712 RepID=A0AA41YPS4_9PROT|nr:VOC family protein [Limobrevibacterium gyesilva]MCW3475993.1 VOC family protein [Limobrevibacterium gyesilva]